MQILEENHKGYVTSYWDNRGYGFIHDYGLKQDVFFHMDFVTECDHEPRIADHCHYDIADSPKGYRAVNVRFEAETDGKPGRVAATSK